MIRVLRERERRRLNQGLDALYHPNINVAQRAVLMNWLTLVCYEGYLQRETLYLAASLADRLCASDIIVLGGGDPKQSSATLLTTRRYQLLGAACVFIAAKYEEVTAPSAVELASLYKDVFTKAELLAMELHVLGRLDWAVSGSTPLTWLLLFLGRLNGGGGGGGDSDSDDVFKRCIELLDVALLTPWSLECPASDQASAALYLVLLCERTGSAGSAGIAGSDIGTRLHAALRVEDAAFSETVNVGFLGLLREIHLRLPQKGCPYRQHRQPLQQSHRMGALGIAKQLMTPAWKRHFSKLREDGLSAFLTTYYPAEAEAEV